MTAGPGDALSHVAVRLLAASHFQQGDEYFSAGDEGARVAGPTGAIIPRPDAQAAYFIGRHGPSWLEPFHYRITCQVP